MTLKGDSKTDRASLLKYLNQSVIGICLIFAENLTKQKYFKKIKYRVSSDLTYIEMIIKNTFFLGVYPCFNKNHLNFAAQKPEEFFDVCVDW